MALSLSPEVQEIIDSKVRSGEYASAEDVIRAGLNALVQQQLDALEPGEFERLVEEGERSIEAEGTFTEEEVFRELQEKSRRHREGKP
jgi:antitoxin ParD1/3/4